MNHSIITPKSKKIQRPISGFKFAIAWIIALIFPLTSTSHAQDFQWTWMEGSNLVNETGIYGTMGEPDEANYPGARNSAISWTDELGSIWLFGGFGRSSTSNNGYLNDLWRYNPSSKQWSWITGSNLRNQNGIYGILETPDNENTPGARENAVSWFDSDGNLWLFGGTGIPATGSEGLLNDLWRYNPATNQWTWTKGSDDINQGGTYGTKGSPDNANTPGSREGAVAWTDSEGNLWLFGGYGYNDTSNIGYLGDLWRFNSTSNQWTWVKGNSQINQNGNYGTLEVPNDDNRPGSRTNAMMWTDNDDFLWLFGGFGYDSVGLLSRLNDLWRYNPTTNQWTWISGSNTGNPSPNYGTQGIPDATNIPGGREVANTWTDSNGNFWLFGGFGVDSTGLSGRLNDLWRYDPITNQWTWMNGSIFRAQNGSFGTLGVPGPANTPSSRGSGVSWVDPHNNLWLFSGIGNDSTGSMGRLNDLWRFGQIFTIEFETDGTPEALIDGDNLQFVAIGDNSTTVTAIAPSGFSFIEWTENSTFFSNENPLIIENVTGSLTLVANFADVTPPMSSAATEAIQVGGDLIGTFTASDDGSGVDFVELYVREPGGSWTNAGTITGGTWSYTPTQSGDDADGLYEFSTVATDLEGNSESAPIGNDPGQATVIYNDAENSNFAWTFDADGTAQFPMTDEIVIEITLEDVSAPVIITVSRTEANDAPDGYDASRLINEQLTITGDLNGATATLTLSFDEDNDELAEAFNTLFQFSGNDLLNAFTVPAGENPVVQENITSFSTWWIGNNNATITDWQELNR